MPRAVGHGGRTPASASEGAAAPSSLVGRLDTGRLGAAPDPIPKYLRDTYAWVYLRPRAVALLDRPLVVSIILWGNYRRLLRAALAELRPGQRVLQPACVYGDLSPSIATLLGADGHLDCADIAPLQVENCRRKLSRFANTSVTVRDAADPVGGLYDVVCCFFLLHEMPEHYKRQVVDALLDAVRPGGKAIFVDYHRPHWLHPLKGVMSLVFDFLEPFAKDLWEVEIVEYASAGGEFTWRKCTYFGGLYQKTIAERQRGIEPCASAIGIISHTAGTKR